MNLETVIFLNRACAKELGWEPKHFGGTDFDEDLVNRIKAFQTEHYPLKVDGIAGPQTYKMLCTSWVAEKYTKYDKKTLYINSSFKDITINWTKTFSCGNSDLKSPASNYRTVKETRQPNLIVLHHDGAFSSRQCFDVLNKRHLSCHFSIDNDGDIYQMVPLNDSAQHAGSFNMRSIGIEISNAVLYKYRDYYINKGLGPRPIVENKVSNGNKFNKILGFYPLQVEAVKVLVKVLCEYYNIPKQIPMEKGKHLTSVYKDINSFSGICGHYNLTEDKWDPLSLDMEEVVKEIQ